MKIFYEYVSSNDKYADKTMTLVDGEDSVSDSAQCAEILNKFFASVFCSGSSGNNNAEPPVPYSMENFKKSKEEVKPEMLGLDTKKILRTG